MNIKKWNYMHGYSSSNYGAHSMAIQIGKVTLWFSYDTVVAFRDEGHLKRTSENLWGSTTGKHLNAISNKEDRLKRDDFEKQLEECLKRHDLTVEG